MRIAICDDDVSVTTALYTFINSAYKDIDMLIERYSSGEELLKTIKSNDKSYELLLLDIEMNGINGMQVAKEVQALLPDLYVVFITSHGEFALAGYEVSAFRFLTKPIQRGKLIEAISAVKSELLNQKAIRIKNADTEAVIKVKDIVYIEAQDKIVRVVQQTQFFSANNGIDFYARLLGGDDFYRVHRSYLINFYYVRFIDKQGIQMANGDGIPISRLRKKQFDEAFQSYVKRMAR